MFWKNMKGSYQDGKSSTCLWGQTHFDQCCTRCPPTLFLIPAGVLQRLDKIRRSFSWQGNETSEGYYHLLKWKWPITSQKQGGLGIKNLNNQCKALEIKWLLRYVYKSQSLWRKCGHIQQENKELLILAWRNFQNIFCIYGIVLCTTKNKSRKNMFLSSVLFYSCLQNIYHSSPTK